MPDTMPLGDQIKIPNLDYLDVRDFVKISFDSNIFNVSDVLLKREIYVNRPYLILVALVKVSDLKGKRAKTYIINYNTESHSLSKVLYG